MNLPNFFLAGAPKAGTTSLSNYLEQHPDVFMSRIKEPSYFCSDIRVEDFAPELRAGVERDQRELRTYFDGPMTQKRLGGMVVNWDDYLKLFRNADGRKAVGEASVIYLWSQVAPREIAARIPHAKILLVLRDPAERAYSHYLHMASSGRVKCRFGELIDADLNDKTRQIGFHHPFLELGLYGRQIERYLQFFPRGQLMIHLYDDYQANQARVLADIFRFLGVDASFIPDTSERARVSRVPKHIRFAQVLKRVGIWQAAKRLAPRSLLPAVRNAVFAHRQDLQMTPADRRRLADYYAEDVGKLAELLGRDLSSWLK